MLNAVWNRGGMEPLVDSGRFEEPGRGQGSRFSWAILWCDVRRVSRYFLRLLCLEIQRFMVHGEKVRQRIMVSSAWFHGTLGSCTQMS